MSVLNAWLPSTNQVPRTMEMRTTSAETGRINTIYLRVKSRGDLKTYRISLHMKKLLCIFLLTTLSNISFASNSLDITTKNNDPVELAVKAKLESLAERYPISRFFYTRRVVVNRDVWPAHSHPVLTIPGKQLFVDDELDLLANFLHEQFHWDVIENGQMPLTEKIRLLKSAFPGAKSMPPYGSGDEASTYSHVVVCYLEFKALSLLLGEQKALEMIKAKPYYTWVYSIVADRANHPIIEQKMAEIGGAMWPSDSKQP